MSGRYSYHSTVQALLLHFQCSPILEWVNSHFWSTRKTYPTGGTIATALLHPTRAIYLSTISARKLHFSVEVFPGAYLRHTGWSGLFKMLLLKLLLLCSLIGSDTAWSSIWCIKSYRLGLHSFAVPPQGLFGWISGHSRRFLSLTYDAIGASRAIYPYPGEAIIGQEILATVFIVSAAAHFDDLKDR